MPTKGKGKGVYGVTHEDFHHHGDGDCASNPEADWQNQFANSMWQEEATQLGNLQFGGWIGQLASENDSDVVPDLVDCEDPPESQPMPPKPEPSDSEDEEVARKFFQDIELKAEVSRKKVEARRSNEVSRSKEIDDKWDQAKKKKQTKVKFRETAEFRDVIHNAQSYKRLCDALMTDDERDEAASCSAKANRVEKRQPLASNANRVLQGTVKKAARLCPVTIANVTNEEFKQKAKELRELCNEERREAEVKALTSMGGMMNIIGAAMGQGSKRSGEWRKISVAIDSGAAETVIPHTLVPEHKIDETEKSKAGLCYASATGEPIPNMGEQRLPLVTGEGSLRKMTFQAAPVAKPLGSVHKICKAGHAVVFDSDCSYIINKRTGEINWLREEQGNYMLDVWVPPPTKLQDQGFGRQP